MSDYTDLVADARSRAESLRRMFPNDGETWDDARLVERLAEAIEALVKERNSFKRQAEHFADRGNQAEADRDEIQADLDAEEDKNARYRTRNDELAAVVENAKSHAYGVMAQLDSYSWHRHDERFVASTRASAFSAYQALSAAPADALREHDAALIESLAGEAEAERERIAESTPDLFTGLGRERSQKLEEQRELQRRTSWLRERARQVGEGEA